MASRIDGHIKTGLGLESRLVRQVVKEILADYGIGKYDLIINSLPAKEMAELNQRFRGIMGSTDVLTFVLESEPVEAEIYLCREQVIQSAAAKGIPLRLEALKLIIHGLLHIAGCHHHNEIEAENNRTVMEKYYIKYARQLENDEE